MADRTPDSSRLLMGFGFDNDEHTRITKGEDFMLMGGSEQTHGGMVDGVLRFQDTLRKMGTDLQRASHDQVLEAAHEAGLASD